MSRLKTIKIYDTPILNKYGPTGAKRRVFLVWLLLYAHRHRSILGAAGHIILTPANQLMVMRLTVQSGFEPATFRSLL
jgi:hypothetical protein